MEYRNFEKLGVSPSLLGFGCMRFPLNEDGSICEPEAEKMLDTAIGAGVTYIDTAYPYHNGDSEPFLGHVLKKYNRKDFFPGNQASYLECKNPGRCQTSVSGTA